LHPTCAQLTLHGIAIKIASKYLPNAGHRTSVRPGFIEEMTRPNSNSGVSRQKLANAATILVAVAAAFWFFRSRRYSRRVEFNVEFNVYESGDPEAKILQVNLMLDNKGQVEHHCYILAYEVVEMRPDGTCVSGEKEGEFVFRSGNLVEENAKYYYVRPGVCQRIVTTLRVPNTVKLAKVRAFFTYLNEGPEIDRSRPLMPQRFDRDDWTALVRVVDLDPGGDALSAAGKIPEGRQHQN
jgi:hypothetical protein